MFDHRQLINDGLVYPNSYQIKEVTRIQFTQLT